MGRRTWMLLSAVVMISAIGYAVAAFAQTRPQSLRARSSDAGRWQLFHGPPTGLYRTFLIDTATGDTWIACDMAEDKNHEGWCFMPRTASKWAVGVDMFSHLKETE